MHKGLNESEKQSIEIQDSSSLPPAFNSRPLIVIIKNNTDDKHYNVPVINPNHKETDSKYSYSSFEGVSYDEALDHFASLSGKEAGMLYVAAFHDLKRYVERQITAGFIIDGEFLSCSYDEWQFQREIVVRKVDFKIKQGMEFNLSFLMPEAEVKIFIYAKP